MKIPQHTSSTRSSCTIASFAAIVAPRVCRSTNRRHELCLGWERTLPVVPGHSFGREAVKQH